MCTATVNAPPHTHSSLPPRTLPVRRCRGSEFALLLWVASRDGYEQRKESERREPTANAQRQLERESVGPERIIAIFADAHWHPDTVVASTLAAAAVHDGLRDEEGACICRRGEAE